MDFKRTLILSGFSLAAMLGGFFLLKPPAKATPATQATQLEQTVAPPEVQAEVVQPPAQEAPKVQYVDVVQPVKVYRPAARHEEHEAEEGEREYGEHDD